ncbi:uncharacterized protein LOC132256810 [Phlebotomus argentipes]|uniref:uncharacterized protein LOC132256810 n=1 Tax=Phlebotomus argentipes TaxID=94469 RepID=UPI0028932C09|nr:uncharacterized protein LOC132256810 [Phlebotomus argentipes]XP_059609352.1 uncharacterized protein LOC132256810 [Phlebotomus argentipes]XP_059609353.1 uncharacterized protein LOC132256810 [Phlebotomus argentipes]XP_059609354.1 uncharacterized protein LOC132256810 [Phlebotomus argentipes]XP_059609355.1 uncharacterized protein LOC132256810 [Phlebotomus argentipes]
MNKKERKYRMKQPRQNRIRKTLTGCDEILNTKYLRKQLYTRLLSSNCSKDCLKNIRDTKTSSQLANAVTEMSKYVQEKLPEIIKDPLLTSMDTYAKLASAENGKNLSNFELSIILKGIHEIYPLPEMQDQTSLNVRNLYLFLHNLSMGQPASALEESSLIVLREAFNELMEEVNSEESNERLKQLQELMKNRRQLEPEGNDDAQHLLQNELNLRDSSLNLFQMPPEVLEGMKDK